jgi:hypothetical protein
MISKPLIVAKTQPPQAFKSVRLVHRYFNVIGTFRYLRNVSPGYDYEKGDILDAKIFQALVNFFPDSHNYYRAYLLFEQQLDNFKMATKEFHVRDVVVTFSPLLTFEDLKSEVNYNAYFSTLQFRYNAVDPNMRQQFEDYLPQELLIYLPANDIKALINSIFSV